MATDGNVALEHSKGCMPKQLAQNLEQLVSGHRGELVRFLTRKLGSPEDAQEIAQEALLRVHQLENADQIDNARAFLFQVASNMATDQLRRRSLQKRYLESETDRAADLGGEPDFATPEKLVAAREQIARIYTAMDTMPLKSRQALMLHRVRGLSYTEIAHEMGVSVSSVEKYILDALKHCRQQLVD